MRFSYELIYEALLAASIATALLNPTNQLINVHEPRTGSTGTSIADTWSKRVRRGHSPSRETSEKETEMEFAAVLIVSNTLMAIFIYIVVIKIWQD